MGSGSREKARMMCRASFSSGLRWSMPCPARLTPSGSVWLSGLYGCLYDTIELFSASFDKGRKNA